MERGPPSPQGLPPWGGHQLTHTPASLPCRSFLPSLFASSPSSSQGRVSENTQQLTILLWCLPFTIRIKCKFLTRPRRPSLTQLLTISPASTHTNPSLFFGLQPEAPSVCSSSKTGSSPPHRLCTCGPFCLESSFPRTSHVCLLLITQVFSSEVLFLTLSTLTQQLQHLACCLAQSNPG